METQGTSKKTTAEKAVSKLRIRQIEKGIRSISSILDNRRLHELEPVVLRDPLLQERSEMYRNARRIGNVNTHTANQASNAVKMLQMKGMNVVEITDEFGDEERIWKNKSKHKSYTQKRRFDNPELEQFRNSLNPEQLRMYKSLSREALYQLSVKVRDEIKGSKSRMDDRGIFHSDANAHRAHCAYLLKMYRSIQASAIEDPVLNLLRDKAEPTFDDLAQYTARSDKHTRSDPALLERPTTSSMKKIRPKQERNSPRPPSHRPDILTINHRPSSPADANRPSSPLRSPSTEKFVAPTKQDIAVPLRRETSYTSLQERRQAEEAAKVPPLPVLHRNQNKSDLSKTHDAFMEGKSSDWLISSLQRKQIDSSLQSSASTSPMKQSISWKDIGDLNKTPRLQTNAETGDPLIPTAAILPYEKFQRIFSNYVEKNNADVERAIAAEEARRENQESLKRSNSLDDVVMNAHKIITQSPPLVDVTNLVKVDLSDVEESAKLIETMQPNLEAFMHITKDKHAASMPRYLYSKAGTRAMTPGKPLAVTEKIPTMVPINPSIRPRTDHLENKNRMPTIGQRAVSQPIRASTSSPRARATTPNTRPVSRPQGFRNVFRDDDLDLSVQTNTDDIEDDKSLNSQEQQETEGETTELERAPSREGAKRSGGKGKSRSNFYYGSRQSTPDKSRRSPQRQVEDTVIVQQKQTAIWEALRVDTATRIALMNKYSSEAFSPELLSAMEQWNDVALLVEVKRHLIAAAIRFQRGSLKVPTKDIDENWLFDEIYSQLPLPLLHALPSHSSLNSRRTLTYQRSLRYDSDSEPNSPVASPEPVGLIEELKIAMSYKKFQFKTDNYHQEILQSLISINKRIDRTILLMLQKAEERFNDTIPYGIVPCKEWVITQKFPVLKVQ